MCLTGYRPKQWKWQWENRGANQVWIGDVDAGLCCHFKTPDDRWSYHSGMPEAWANGAVEVVEEGTDRVVVRARSGVRRLRPGQEYEFRFALMITPFKPLDPAHWSGRYCDGWPIAFPLDRAKELGVTVQLEGLRWLIENVGIDGIYLDGIGYDRQIMKRVRKVMDRAKPGCLIDFHSGNGYSYADRKVSPACRYMEHFPFVNSLWFGEGYDYDETPDYWLVEISGIPFGLFGEMLGPGSDPWRGMVYGMTGR